MLRKYRPDPSMLPLAWATAESFWKDWEPAHQSLNGISSEVQWIQGKAYSWHALVQTHPSSLLPYPCYKLLGLIIWAPCGHLNSPTLHPCHLWFCQWRTLLWSGVLSQTLSFNLLLPLLLTQLPTVSHRTSFIGVTNMPTALPSLMNISCVSHL